MPTQIQLRRGTAATWTSNNPTLASGEVGVETDTGKFKVGNGSDNWASRPYASGIQGTTGAQGAQGASDILGTITISAQTASYTLALGDQNKLIEMNLAGANTLTIPTNTVAPFATGTQISILQTGAGQTTVSATSGVTLNSVNSAKKLSTQWSSATLIKRGTDTWVLFGDLVS